MSNFTKEQLEEIWRKGREVEGKYPEVYRKDAAGSIVKKDDRRVESEYGWEVDHVSPSAKLKERGIPKEHWDALPRGKIYKNRSMGREPAGLIKQKFNNSGFSLF